ncbi:unnamed protein product [Schistosoma curassoni]|uniref:Uncharacterized protein n=1 Tax=Schistosoma curassoni TaxID=6186 RepID=A0A183JQS0_9TREM|nr:unnamed protein product [Schistosoma curassoni]
MHSPRILYRLLLFFPQESHGHGQTISVLDEHDGCLSSPKQNKSLLISPNCEQRFDFVIDTQQKEVINNSEAVAVNEKTSEGFTLSDKQDNLSPGPEDDDGEVDEEDDDDDDDDDKDEDDDNEDDDDDDDEKRVVEPVERYEPQTVHVNPPERAPSHPALFTHCQYFINCEARDQCAHLFCLILGLCNITRARYRTVLELLPYEAVLKMTTELASNPQQRKVELSL